MAKKNKTKKLEDKIKEAKNLIIANSKDAARTKKLLTTLTSLQKQADVEAVELIVPTKEVLDEIKEDTYSYKRTPRGILFQTKSGLNVFVENRIVRTHGMLAQLFELRYNPPQDEEMAQVSDAFYGAVTYLMQAPIFASLSEEILFETATNLISNFNNFVKQNIDDAELKPETEQDINDNNTLRNALEAIENIEKDADSIIG